MKLLVCVLALTALVQLAQSQVRLRPPNSTQPTSIDWSKVKRRDLHVPLPFAPESLRPETRIIGGQEAQPHQFPFLAALLITLDSGTYFCGGSLISLNYVLTAAHCVADSIDIAVILGAHSLDDIWQPGHLNFGLEYTLHWDWFPGFYLNDIATIRLLLPVTLNDEIQLVQLPTYSMISNQFTGVTSTLIGWGSTTDGGGLSEFLRFVETNVIANLVCNVAFLGIIMDSHICTSGMAGVGICDGDSGGPVFIDPVQVGVVNFAITLGCEVGWPSVHSRVTSFLDWIAANSDVTIQP